METQKNIYLYYNMARKNKTARKPLRSKRKHVRSRKYKHVRSRKYKHNRKRVKKNQNGGVVATGSVFFLKKVLELIESEGSDILDKCFKEQGFENLVELRGKANELKDKLINIRKTTKKEDVIELVEELIKMKDSLIKLASLNKSDLINCFKSSMRAKLSNKINKPLEVLGSGISKLKGRLKPDSNMGNKINKLKDMIDITKSKLNPESLESVSDAHADLMKKLNP